MDNDTIISHVRENFPGFFDKRDEVQDFHFDRAGDESAEDGFPEPMDLSACYEAIGREKLPIEGESIFAAFIRMNLSALERDENTINKCGLNADIDENDFHAENDNKIKQMEPEEIEAALEEIKAHFPSSALEFLKNRGQKKPHEAVSEVAAKKPFVPKTMSKFRRSRMEGDANASQASDVSVQEDEDVKNLELFNFSEGTVDVNDPASRLALNAVQMDLASKAFSFTVPRQQVAWLSIFDKLSVPVGNDEIEILAVQKMNEIKELYVEEIQVSPNKKKYEFAKDINPASDGSWMFVPIRRVLDAIQTRQDRSVTDDDVEIIRLTFLFCVLFTRNQSTLLSLLGTPSAAMIYVSEVFLIGPKAFNDDIIEKCINELIDGYFLKAAKDKKLAFTTATPIARIDAFLPFFSDLVKVYTGERMLARILFIMACMNRLNENTIVFLINLWHPETGIIRGCSLTAEDMEPCIDFIKCLRIEQGYYFNASQNVFHEYGVLLVLYASAILCGVCISSRNPGLFNLAMSEINGFLHNANESEGTANESAIKDLNAKLLPMRQKIMDVVK